MFGQSELPSSRFCSAERDIIKAKKAKYVVIIGGGPAGMKAAITAYDRGHKVTLIEKEAELGGMLRVIVKEGHKKEVRPAFALLPYTNRKTRYRDFIEYGSDTGYGACL